MEQRTAFELEDVLADHRHAQASDSGEAGHETPVRRRSLRVALVVVWALLAVFAFRTFSLAVLQGSLFSGVAEQSRQRESIVVPPRGAIVDRRGVTLVENVSSFVLLFDSLSARRLDAYELAHSVARTARIVEVPQHELEERIALYKDQAEPRVVASDIPQQRAVEFSVSHIPEAFYVEAAYRRTYRADARFFAPVVGYVGLVNEQELAEQPELKPRESIGKSGVEKQYDAALRGIPGIRTTLVDARGMPRREAITQDPAAGKNIRLTVDAELTTVLGKALESAMRTVHAEGAAAVALDPADGSVRALVSLPTFDPEALSHGLSEQEYQKLITNARSPFLNRAIAGVYPSGSTIKPFIASAALAENIISPSRKIDDTAGFIQVQSIYDPAVSWTFRDWKPHGFVDLIDAIARSADVYFYEVGGGYHDVKGLGVERIDRYLEAFGFGSALGIDLDGEHGGMVPTPEWKDKTLHEQWFVGDTYNLSIGQGALGVTPLQLAAGTAAIANGGHLYVPRVADALVDDKGNAVTTFAPRLLRDVPVPAEDLAMVRRGMRVAVTAPYGTNRILATLPVSSAAKTGTAQYGNAKKTHAWVTAFAPYEHPTIVFAIVVEGGGEGTVATAVVKEVLEWYAANRTNNR